MRKNNKEFRNDFDKQYALRQFEGICSQYLIHQNRAGEISIPFDRIEKYYYDDPQTRTNDDVDIATEDSNGYVFCETKRA